MKNLLTEHDRTFFQKNGYIVLNQMLNEKEVQKYLLKMKSVFEIESMDNKNISKNTYKIADGMTKNEEFWDLITDDRIVNAIRFLYEDDICYAQHSDLHINNTGGRLHRDSRDRIFGEGGDWDESNEKYGVVRVPIYLSDYNDCHSSILIYPKSHKTENFLQKFEFKVINKLTSILRKFNLNNYIPKISITRQHVVHKTKPGDVVIFDQRLVHASGNLKRNKGFSRYAMFLSYGLKNSHTQNHRNYYIHEKALGYLKDFPDKLMSLLANKNLLNN